MNAIVAVDRNWAIGKDNALLFHVKEDMANFRALTAGHPVVLGRRTLESFPGGKPLPKRPHYLLTRDEGIVGGGEGDSEVRVFHDLESLMDAVPWDAWLIGGSSLYGQLIGECQRAYVTRIYDEAEDADSFFPDLTRMPGWYVEERRLLREADPRAELVVYRNHEYQKNVMYETGIETPESAAGMRHPDKMYVTAVERLAFEESARCGRNYLQKTVHEAGGKRTVMRYDFANRTWARYDGKDGGA